MNDLELYNIFRTNGMTRAGALGTMANIRAEGVMRGNNAQDSYGYDDAQYTAAVDTGNPEFLERFCDDAVGYGYAQWTDPKRKRRLLAYALNKGTSIGDEAMQASFIIKEMKEDFPSVWEQVSTSDDLRECVWTVLNVYENPQIKNLDTRYKFALEFEEKIPDGAVPAPQDDPAAAVVPRYGDDLTVKLLQLAMAHDGYWEPDEITGIKTPEFRQRIVEYAEAVAGC